MKNIYIPEVLKEKILSSFKYAYAFLLFSISVISALSLFSFNINDNSFLTNTSGISQNLLGDFGSYYASFIFYTFGILGYMIIIFFLIYSVLVTINKSPKYIFIRLLLFFISLMILIWTKRKSSTQIISSGKNQISPNELAKKRLLHLDTNGFSKEFYSELSHITRQFVEKSCYIRALEMTTEEINENENIFNMNDDIFSEWINLLQKADVIKFAKKSTPISEMENDKSVALNIIDNALN